MRFSKMTSHELAKKLLEMKNMPVLIEDQDACLVAHDRIRFDTVEHSVKGRCLALSALVPVKANANFTYVGETCG